MNTFVHYSAACMCAGLAFFALLRDRRSLASRYFALGMVVLAMESFFIGQSIESLFPERAVYWQTWRFLAMAAIPGVWMLFSLCFGQDKKGPLPAKWKYSVLAAVFLQLIFLGFFQENIFQDIYTLLFDEWTLNLGWSGYVFQLCFLLSLILPMMFLERILRASKGRKRWQVKFLVLGMGIYFATRIFTSSHTLLFHTLDLSFEIINGAALLAATLLILISILRAGSLQFDIYVSQQVIHRSFTALVVGLFFLALGISTRILESFLAFPFRVLFVFLGLLGLFMLLLSDRMRLRMKHFVSRHFRRPRYDYRKVWTTFTRQTTAMVEEKPLCEAVVKIISEMMDTLSVSLWLLDEKRQKLRCAGSTVFTEAKVGNDTRLEKGVLALKRVLQRQQSILDLEQLEVDKAEELIQVRTDLVEEGRIRYVVPLWADNDFLGFITLGDRVKGEPMFLEEFDMLSTIADQVAASLLNINRGKSLRQAKEMEAFQCIAAFFVHDLKNLTAKHSFMLQNLSEHFGNPEFRDDALRLISNGVEQINSITGRLSLFREKLEIRPCETDLNEVVAATLSDLEGIAASRLIQKLEAIPKVSADPVQIRKVLTNLVMNANDAVGDRGEIRVVTGKMNGWVSLSVSDNGCGMSKEFMDQLLFQPFRTTKRNGTGIGLFQSKMIVEAHKGTIEVESRVDQGSKFRVLLPLNQELP